MKISDYVKQSLLLVKKDAEVANLNISELADIRSKPKLNEYGKLISYYPCPSHGGKVRFKFEKNSIDVLLANANAIHKTSEILRAYHLDDKLSPEEFIQANLVYDVENAGNGKTFATAAFTLINFTLSCLVFVLNFTQTGHHVFILVALMLWIILTIIIAIIILQMPQRYEIPAKMAQAVVELRRKNIKPEDGLSCYDHNRDQPHKN